MHPKGAILTERDRALPFRWFSEDDRSLDFEYYERSTGTTCKAC
jgi:hypothetical protein